MWRRAVKASSPPWRVRTRAAAMGMAVSGIPGPGELNVSVNRPSRRVRAGRARPHLGSAPVLSAEDAAGTSGMGTRICSTRDRTSQVRDQGPSRLALARRPPAPPTPRSPPKPPLCTSHSRLSLTAEPEASSLKSTRRGVVPASRQRGPGSSPGGAPMPCCCLAPRALQSGPPGCASLAQQSSSDATRRPCTAGCGTDGSRCQWPGRRRAARARPSGRPGPLTARPRRLPAPAAAARKKFAI